MRVGWLLSDRNSDAYAIFFLIFPRVSAWVGVSLHGLLLSFKGGYATGGWAVKGVCLWQDLDVFLAGDDVPNKKPDPKIYQIAAEKLGLDPAECLVVEDSSIGLQASNVFLFCFVYPGLKVDPKKIPDPEIYQISAEKLGLDSAECMLVEDSSTGLQASNLYLFYFCLPTFKH